MLVEASSSSASPSRLPQTAPVFKEPFSADAIWQLVIGLAIVVGMILLLSWFLRRFSGITPVAKNMRVIGALPLGTREKAVLIQVGEKQILLGVAPGRVSRIESFDEPVVNVDEMTTFGTRLSEAIQRRNNKDA